MIDLHTHTVLSDGDLVPTELARRAEVLGFRVLGMADHVDTALVESVVPVLVQAAKRPGAGHGDEGDPGRRDHALPARAYRPRGAAGARNSGLAW